MAYGRETEEDEGVNVVQRHYDDTFNRQASAGSSASEDMLRNAENNGVTDDDARAGARDFGSEAEQRQRRAEERAGFTNKVTGKSRNGEQGEGTGLKSKSGKSKIMRNAGPIVAIIVSLLGLGGGAIFGQTFMPFALDAMVHDNFNSMRTISTLRTKKFLRLQMDHGRVKDVTQAKIFGSDKFKISKRQEAKFKQNNIEVDRNYDLNGKKATVLKHYDQDGKLKIAVADPKMAGGGHDYLWDLYDSDVSFRNDFFNGAKTWRGAIYQWYDTKTAKLLANFKLARNKWFGHKPKNNDDVDAVSNKIKADADVKGTIHGTDVEYKKNDKGELILNEEGKPILDKTGKVETDSHVKLDDAVDVDTMKTDVMGMVTARAESLSKGSEAANAVCMVSDLIGSVGMLVAAAEVAQILQVAIPIFEAIEKAKAGEGGSSPINVIANQLAKPAKSKYINNYEYKENGSEILDYIEIEGSAMDSNSVSAMFGRHAMNGKDPSVRSFNIFGRMSNMRHIGGFSKESFLTCTMAKMANSAISATTTVVTVASCILGAVFTAGVSCSGLFTQFIIETALGATVSAAVSLALDALIPSVVDFFKRDLVSNLVGEDLGNAVAGFGGNKIMGTNEQYGGGALASESSLIAYSMQHHAVLADNARHDRETRSPFDVTTPNTFLGSIASKMIPITFHGDRFGGGLSAMTMVASNSLKELSPTTYAMQTTDMVTETAKQTAENCPYLDSIGAVGDAFCNPYFITDISTIEDDPADVVIELVKEGQLEDKEGDVPTIKKDSDLAKHIVYCGERQSTFGVADHNIAAQMDETTGSDVADTILGAVPIVGDIADVFSNSKRLKNVPYITGEACVIGNKHEGMGVGTYSTPEWEEAKTYQRFIEDQRLAESTGLVEKSAVSIFLEDYYKENPIDNSFEGVLAEMSGLTKNEVIATLDEVSYLAELMEYDPVGRLPLQKNKTVIDPAYKLHDEERLSVPSLIGALRQLPYVSFRHEAIVEA